MDIDPERLRRGVEVLTRSENIRLFLLLLTHNVRLADAIDIIGEYEKERNDNTQ